MGRRRKTEGEQVVDRLNGLLDEGLEWTERELETLDSVRRTVDRRVLLEGLLAVEASAPEVSTRRVTELAAEIRQADALVSKWVKELEPDGPAVKSAAHQKAARARWGTHG